MGKMPLCCYILSRKLFGYNKYCLLLSAVALYWSAMKFLIGNFSGVPNMNFILDWESEIANQSGLQVSLSENWCYYAKMRVL